MFCGNTTRRWFVPEARNGRPLRKTIASTWQSDSTPPLRKVVAKSAGSTRYRNCSLAPPEAPPSPPRETLVLPPKTHDWPMVLAAHSLVGTWSLEHQILVLKLPSNASVSDLPTCLAARRDSASSAPWRRGCYGPWLGIADRAGLRNSGLRRRTNRAAWGTAQDRVSPRLAATGVSRGPG